jgi:serine-type D-Ala-D-Ala carboxypeptidase (penicillin-binding protein 5/6)
LNAPRQRPVKLFCRLVAVLLWTCVATVGYAQAPSLPPLSAKAWLLLDISANHLIVQNNVHERMEPASLTKLMTAYLSFTALKEGRLKRDQVVIVSPRAWKTGGSRMYIEPQRKVTVEELLQGMIVQSGNDASVALAETIAGTEDAFVLIMNKEAKRLGMNESNFVNSHGLPDAKHYSSAYDIALLAAAIIREFPDFYPLYSVKEYKYNNINQQNRNRLLWLDPNVDGMKTGHTESAGFCLVASAKRGPRRLLSVVMGTASDNVRTQESQTLLNFGFQFFDTVQLHEKGKPISSLRVWKGSLNELKAGVDTDLFVAIPKGTNDKIKAELSSQQPLVAPILKGQRIGTMKVAYDGRNVSEYPVVALEEVPLAGWFGRAIDTVRLWLN